MKLLFHFIVQKLYLKFNDTPLYGMDVERE